MCNYCDFFKHVLDDDTQVTKYEKTLTEQWKVHKEFLGEKGFELGDLETFYLGGGTPSLWGESGVNFLKRKIDEGELNLESDCEFTLEVDPDAWTEEEIQNWLKLGVNRVSIGAQSFNEKYLKILDRQHTIEDVDKTLKYFKNHNVNFSVDFLIGIPNSEERDIEKELGGMLSYEPNHMSVYILKTRKNYPHNDDMPEDDFVAEEYLKVCKVLNEAGLRQYEVSNFAKKGFRSEHNLNYWRYRSVAAIGANGTGLLVDEGKANRYQWKSSSAGFHEDIISDSSLIIEKLFLQFRTEEGVDIDNILANNEQILTLDRLYESWLEKGYLSKDSSRKLIKLSSKGYLVCDSILDDIFRDVNF